MKKLIIFSLITLTQTHISMSMLIKQKSTCLQRHTKKLCTTTTSNNIEEIFNKNDPYKHSLTPLLLYHRNADIIKILNKNIDILRKQQELAFNSTVFPIMPEIYQLERELHKSFDIKKVE
jgi:hypothetical protein